MLEDVFHDSHTPVMIDYSAREDMLDVVTLRKN